MPFVTEPKGLKTLAFKAFYKHFLSLFPPQTCPEAEIEIQQNATRQFFSDRLDDHFNVPMGNEMRYINNNSKFKNICSINHLSYFQSQVR